MGICDDITAYGVDKTLLAPYLAELGTNNKGTFVDIPNTAAPGGVFYRRDLAKEYFGTDDPEEIGKMMLDWGASWRWRKQSRKSPWEQNVSSSDFQNRNWLLV